MARIPAFPKLKKDDSDGNEMIKIKPMVRIMIMMMMIKVMMMMMMMMTMMMIKVMTESDEDDGDYEKGYDDYYFIILKCKLDLPNIDSVYSRARF